MKPTTSTRQFHFYPLEDRILLSGEGIDGEALDVDADAEVTAALLADVDAEGEANSNTSIVDAVEQAEQGYQPETFDPALPLEVIFIDAGVDDPASLLGDLGHGDTETQWLIVRLDAAQDGVQQISDTLGGLSGVDAIHLLSHGDGSGIQLGNVRLDGSTAAGYAGQISSWSSALDTGADLLIYGCDLASTDDGRELIDSIAELSQCDVAASDDATGHADLGGDWELEYQVGLIDTSVAFGSYAQQAWFSTLATATFSQGDANGYSGTQDTELDSGSTSADRSGTTTLTVDNEDDGDILQSMIRFDNIFGDGAGQIPEDAIITSASLSLNVTGETVGTISLHRMLQDWTDSTATWNSMTNGLSADGVEMALVADSQLVAPGTGTATFTGLEKSVQRWLDEGTNYGWGFLTNSTDGFDFSSSESGNTPLLSVDYVMPGTQSSTAHTLTVDTTLDVNDGDVSSIDALLANKGSDGLISFREALLAAEATTNDISGPDLIQFNLSTSDPNYIDPDATPANGDEYWTITPDYFLGWQQDAVIIDGQSQAGYDSGTGRPVIEIDGQSMNGTATMLFAADGNTFQGFSLTNSPDEAIEIQSSNNIIQNNWIGIDPEGNIVGNAQHGIMITNDANNNQIGGTGANEGNVIGGTGASFAAIIIQNDSDNNIIEGNFIGVLDDGVTSSQNLGHGILIQTSSDSNRIGGTTAGAGNVISGNGSDGIYIDGTVDATYTTVVDGTLIQGNMIGVDGTGTVAVGNADEGISIQNNVNGTIIGGTTASARNIISGNDGAGILIQYGTTGTLVQGNYIGTDVTGTLDLGNGKVAAAGDRSGIRFFDVGTGNVVGGAAAGAGNLIAFNEDSGVSVLGTSTGVAILGNSMHSNNGLAIDLGGDGVDTNDAGDADGGPNGKLNYAEWTSISYSAGSATVDFDLDVPAGSYRVEFYSNTSADPSGNGEGETLVHSETITHTGSGVEAFSATFAINGSLYISATVTADLGGGSYGSTSEFSANALANPATNDAATTDQNTAFNVAAPGVLANDADPFPGQSLQVTEVEGNAANVGTQITLASGALVTLNADGSYTYDPNGAFDDLDDGDSTTDSFTYTVSDNTDTWGSGTVTITINGINDAPTITSDGGAGTANLNRFENDLYVTIVTASDVDLPADTLTYSIIGGTDSAKFSIDSSTGVLSFVSAPDYETPTDSNTDNIYDVTVQVSDGTQTDSQAISITIDDVADDGQFLDLFSSTAYNNSDGLETWSTSWVESEGDGAGNGNFRVQNNELRIRASDLGANLYRSVDLSTAVSAELDFTYSNGLTSSDAVLVQISGDGGTSYTTLTTLDNSTNTGTGALAFDVSSYLSADTRVRFFVSGNAGGNSLNIDDVQFSYVPNTAPTITSDGAGNSATVNVDEGTTAVTTVVSSDPDTPGQTLTYSIVGGADAGLFTIDSSTGELDFNTAPDYESPADSGSDNTYDVQVQVSDGIATDTQTIAVTVDDVDEFDVGAVTDNDAAANEVDENATIGTVVGVTASASDDDGTNNTITYSLTDNDGGRFAIDANTGVVIVAGTIDREADGASRNITVRATSSDGSFTDQGFTIGINDLDEFDVGAVTDSDAAANTVDENAANGTVVGITALASDADATTNNINYSLDDNAGGRFAIDTNTGVITVADGTQLDYETATSHNITVRATSADGSFTTAGMTINLNDLDEFDVGAVSDTDAATNEVDENATVGTAVGVTASATDDDGSNNTITYSLTDNDGGRFAIDANTGVVTVAGAIDREADRATRNITVRATSSDGSFTDQGFTIGINDLDEFDVTVVTDNDAAANEVDENAANGTVVGITALASDADATTNNITYSLDDDAAGRFAIDTNTGVVTVADGTQLDYEATTSHNITVRATSADGSFSTAGMTINLNDLDEFDVGAVSDTDLATNEVDENATIGTVVGVTASATDDDGTNNTISYSLTDNDGGRFAIDANTGVVIVAGTIDREADGASRNITVRATSADGSFTDQAFTIGINDLDEFDVGAVTDNDATANTVDENAANGTVVGITVLASDDDATTSTITYSLDDNAGGRFAIDSNTGVVTVADGTQLDYETASSHNITTRATSADGSFSTAGMTINLNPVNDNTPMITSDGGGATASLNRFENNSTVTTITASDADLPAETLTYSIVGGADAALFTLNSSTGQLDFTTSPDYESPSDSEGDNIYEVQVQVSDGSNTDTQAIAVTIADVNESPTIATNSGTTVLEGSTGNTISNAMLNEGDVDDSGTGLTYTVTDATDNGTLYLSGFGALGLGDTFTQADIDAGNITYDHNGTETLSDAFSFTLADGGEDGATSASGTFAITITSVNDAPTFSSSNSVTIQENETSVTTVTTTDPDGGAPLYSISGGADQSLFAIDANTGVLVFLSAPDYETPTDFDENNTYEVQVTADDGNTGTTQQLINVTVTNVADTSFDGSSTMIWSESGTTTPETADFNGIDFSIESNTADIGGPWRVIAGAEAPDREEKIIVGVDATGNLSGQMWDGSAWTAFSFNDFATVSDSTKWGFAVEYEAVSGDAVLVWNNGTTGGNPLSYRTWDGTSWSATNTIATPVTGEAEQMRLAHDPHSDEMTLVVSNANHEDFAVVWDGDTWGNAQTLNTVAGNSTTEVYVAYEAASGDAMVIYGDNTADAKYRIWDGSSWTAQQTISPPSGVSGQMTWTHLASDPNSDRLALAVHTSNNETWFAVWDGTSWGSQLLASTDESRDDFLSVSVAFEGESGELLAVYSEDNNKIRFRTWDSGSGWSAKSDGTDFGNKVRTVVLSTRPGSDEIMLSALDDGKDVHAVLWDGESWGEEKELENDTNERYVQPFLFLWDQNPPEVLAAKNDTAFWFNTDGDIASDGASGLNSWTAGEVLSLGDPSLSLEPVDGQTSGAVGSVFNIDDFGGDVQVDALHYVSSDIQVGSSNFDLFEGDVVFSLKANETLISTNTLSSKSEDVIVFRPDTAGDYSSGSFYVLLDNPAGGNVRSISLVEADTVVGDTTLQAGDFLLSTSKSVMVFETNDVGEGTTSGTLRTLLRDSDAGINIDQNINGVELYESETVIGGHTIASGTIVLSLDKEDAVGSNAVSIRKQDLFALNVSQTTLVAGDGNGSATAQLLMDGSDIGLIDGAEKITAFSAIPNNQAPTDITPDGFSVDEHIDSTAGHSLGALTTTDVDDGETFTYTIVGGTDEAKFSIGGASSDELLITDGILDYESQGLYTVSVRVTDSDLNFYDETLVITVNDLNDAPVIDNTGTMTLTTINEDQTGNTGDSVADILTSAGGDRVTDQDVGAVEGIAVTGLNSSNGTWQYSLDGTNWFDVGSVSDSTALLLETDDRLRFIPDTIDADTASVSFRAWDRTSGAAGAKVDASTNGVATAFSASSESASITVTAINDAPTVATNTGVTVLEGSTANTITSAMLNEGDVDDSGAGLTYTVTNVTDHGTVYLAGFGAIGVNDTFTQADIDAGNVTYDHDDTENFSDSFSFSLADGGEDGAAATTGSFSITITPVNDNSTSSISDTDGTSDDVLENASVGTTVGITAFAQDSDTGDIITYSLDDDDGGRFTIDSSTGVVTVAGAIDREADGASRNITVRATSSDSSFQTQSYSIAIGDIDEFDIGPIADNDATANAVDENAANGTVVGITALASDDDATTDTITYSLDDDAGGRFAIDSNTGVVTVADGTQLDYEAATSHNITVRATSADGSFSTAGMTINLNDLDEFDVGTVTDVDAATNEVDENATVGTVVGVTASATDGDGSNNTITYSLTDNDGGRFAIDANTGVVTVAGAIDREADGASRNITVRATSSDGSFTDQGFTIGINDLDEFDVTVVTDNDATANEVDENATNGTVVGITALASDADATTNNITYSLDDNAGGRFAIDSNSGVVTVADGTQLDYEAATSHNITVRATSADGSFSTAGMTINLNDLDEFDVGAVTDVDAATNEVDENSTIGTVVGVTASATDDDGSNNTITYSLTDNDGGRFAIDANTGVVTVAGAIDREADGATRNITVRATSSDGSFTDQGFTIGINDLDEFDVTAVTDNDVTANEVDENAANGTVVGITALASDADATTNNVSYSLDDNAGGRFAIDGNTGVVTVADGTQLDYEAATSHNITVRATSADGSFSTAGMTINLNAVNDNTPTITSDGGGATASLNRFENDLYVTTIVANDADLPAETLTYSIVGGLDSSKFTIDSSTGILSFVSAPDFETPTDSGTDNTYDVTVQVSDGTNTDSQAIAVSIDDVADNGQFLDLFSTASYSNSDGSEAWTSSWVESEGDGTGSGDFRVFQNELRIKAAVVGANIYRSVDLSTAVSGTLDFTYGNTLTATDAVEVQISGDGGSNYTTLATMDNSTNSGTGSLSFDISSYLSADTRVRFIVTGAGGGNFLTMDDVQFSYVPNTAPTITSDGGGSTASLNIDEGTTAVTTVTTSDPDVPGQTLTYSIVGGADAARFTIDSSTGELDFATASDYESPTDSGTDNVYDVQIQVSDGIDTDTQSIAVTVDDVDEFDVGAVSDVDAAVNEVDENATVGTVVGVTASATDDDGSNNTITYSLTDNDGGRFAIDANTGVVTVAGAIDREADGSSRNITVRATSSDGSFTDQGFTIGINDLDEFDITAVTDNDATANAVDENAANGSVVGITALASDADATTNNVTYSLDDNASGRFAIDSNTGVVTVADGTQLDYEAATSHGITVRATSADGSFSTAGMTINLNDLDEFDVGAVSDVDAATNEVDENATIGTVVGVTASATDDDGSNNTITYSLTDNDGGRFAIDANTGVVTVAGAIDREADGASRNITVRATSSDGSFTDQGFTIGINDLDEFDISAVTDNDAAANEVDENAANGTVVGITALASDADATTNNVSYSLDDNAGGRFAIDGNTGVVTVADGTQLDYEAATSHNITVRATSADGSFSTAGMTINLNDLDEFDVGAVSDVDAATNEVDENATIGTVVGVTASATDDDGSNNTVTYSLTDNDGGRFAIDANTGVVTVAGAIDREADGATRNITVRATSSDGSFTDQGFTIGINDLDEFDITAVTDSDATANEVDENAANGTVVGITALASDADATTNNVTYSLDDNAGGRFAIDTNTGVVTVADGTQLDYEAATSHNITVRATSADGSFSTAGMTINLNDLDEFDVGAVTDVDAATNEVDENATIGTVVGVTASATDDDGSNNTVTYSLTDNDGGRFAIDANTGVVTVAGAIDREADGATRNITVRATSSDGSFTDQGFTIGINDLDEFDISAVTDNDAAANEVDENAANGTVVGITALASDADATTNNVSYSLDDNAGGRFAIDGNTGVVTVADGTQLDYEAATSHNITVRATSADGSFSTAGMTINLNDLDEFDVGAVSDVDAATNEVDENATIGTVVGVTASATDDDGSNNTITYSLTDNDGGRFAIDANTGVVTVAGAIDREADGASRNVTVRATSSDGSFTDQGFTIGINDLDEFDTTAVTDSDAAANEVDENATNGTVVGITALASDADATTNNVTYSLDDNAGGRFAIDSNSGVVTVADGTQLDYEAATSHNITVRATSADGSFSTAGMTINLNDLDEFDVGAVTDVDAATNEVDENSTIGTVVGVTASATDDDGSNNTITYSLTDNDGGRFNIDANTGVVTVAGAIDREADGASRNITVRATSSDGSFSDQGFAININDVDEFDVGAVNDLDATTNAVDENATIGTVVGVTASAADNDSTNNTITYSLTDNDGGRFAIDANTGVVTVAGAIDREADGASRNITVRATSSDGSFTDQGFTIGINDLDEFDITAVTDNDATANEVDENAANGTVVGITALASDADATTNNVSYSLDDNAGGRFAIDGNTGVVTVADGTQLDYEAATSHNITVRATSADGSFSTAGMTINLNDLDEFDVGAVSDVDAATNEVDENATIGTVVGVTASATDDDGSNNTITYSLTDNDGGRFAIDANTGVVTVAGAIDREADGATRNITVRATSSDGSFTDQGFTIGINDLDEFDITAVTDSDATANEVDENAANGTVVGITALASDADATTNNVTYSLDDNAGGRFAIDGNTGVVTVADGTQLDYEAATSHNITVRATSADGSFSTAGMTINLNDLDEFDVGAVTDVDAATNEVDENATIGTVVGVTASATDDDGSNNTVTYNLTDNDGGRFAIDANTGVVTVAGTIDREADGASRNITVRATSSDGSFTDQGFTIGINDLDEFDISAVTDNDAAANEVDENAANGTVVGITALASDADATTNNVTYSLDDNAGGRFAIDANTGVVTVADGTQLNYEAATSHNIAVRATSADGSTTTATMTINLHDLDEFDVGPTSDTDAATNEVTENAAIGTTVGVTASASDNDGSNNTISYSLDDNDGGRFAIDNVTGVVTVAGSIDREADGASRAITVRSTSSDGSSTTAIVSIAIVDVDEFDVTVPTDSDATANEVNENSAFGTLVGIVASASDNDATDTLTYSLDDSASNRFAIDSSSGAVTVNGGIDFETATSHDITVRVTSTDGSTQVQVFTIDVVDVNEAPIAADDTFSMFAGTTMNEPSPGVIFNDSDIDGDTLTTVLVNPPSNGTLTLLPGGGLTYTPAPGFTGTDSFVYRASDGALQSNLATVQIEVSGAAAPDPPAPPPPADPPADPDPAPDPDPDPEPADEPELEDSGSQSESDTASGPAGGLQRGNEFESADQEFAEATRSWSMRESSQSFGMSDGGDDGSGGNIRSGVYLQSERQGIDAEVSSIRSEMMERLLAIDLEQAIVWQVWDEGNGLEERASHVFFVGTAGSAVSLVSVGYVLWALRGGAVMTAVASSLPSWRVIDPTALLSAYRSSGRGKSDGLDRMLGG